MAFYQENELVMALTDGGWVAGYVMERTPDGRYEVLVSDILNSKMGQVGARYSFSDKKMSRAQVFVCSKCGNWMDALANPTVPSVQGSKRGINFRVEPLCYHNDMPYTMGTKPWNEVRGVTAIGGIRSVSSLPPAEGAQRDPGRRSGEDATDGW